MEASSSRSGSDAFASQLLKEKDHLRKEISIAVEDQDDILGAYEQFVKWLVQHEQHSTVVRDFELLEVLDEALRAMMDDRHYKQDLRYIKLWTLYARRIRNPATVYAYLFKHAIGTSHSQLYEECALGLEEEGKLREAEDAYKIGLKKSTRAVERLKSRYKEFQNRVATSTTLKRDASELRKNNRKDKTTPGALLFRDPFKNFSAGSSSSGRSSKQSRVESKSTPTSLHSNGHSDTQRSKQQPLALTTLKGGEKLHIDLSLLEKDGIEMSIQEARAASLGLLGRKWGPPPPSEADPHQTFTRKSSSVEASMEHDEDAPKGVARVLDKTDAHTRHLRMNMRMSIAGTGEPTVTINTKEALQDVFGMYNSPDKTTKLPGSKHSLVKKVEPVTPAGAFQTRKAAETPHDENQPIHGSKTPGSFRLFVDDEMKKENTTPAPTKKLSVFCDEEDQNETAPFTPAPRPALAEIRATTPSNPIFIPYEDESDENSSKLSSQAQVKSVFARVFTPVNLAEKTKPKEEVDFVQDVTDSVSEEEDRDDSKGSSGLSSVFSRPPSTRPTSTLEDRDVFGIKPESKPTAAQNTIKNEPVFRRKSLAASKSGFAPVRHHPPAPESQTAISQPIDIEDSDGSAGAFDDDDYDDEDQYSSQEPAGYQQEYYQDYEEDYQAPMGGRLGRFDVMTPIAERTIEYTMSTRVPNTPTHHIGEDEPKMLDGVHLLRGDSEAALIAEKLARELQDDVDATAQTGVDAIVAEEEEVTSEFTDDLVERTCNLSLADAIVAASSNKPPNPCNPTDPQIVSTLLSLIPPEGDFHNLASDTSSQFDGLQRFASKLRRNSGKSASSRSHNDCTESYRLTLKDRKFEVIDKLGEGGFGTVFLAKAIGHGASDSDDDSSESSEDFADDDETNVVALKVVRPRNLWEYHILRRVHNTLPPSVRTSIINPQGLYAFRDESFLVLDLCSQGTLLDVVNRATEAGVAQKGGCLDELLVMFFTIELLKFIEAMHSSGFIHGDLKIDNCLVRLEDVPGGSAAWSGMYQASGEMGWKYKGIKMIDFGRTIDTRMFPSGQQFIADWKAEVGDCLEMRLQKPWTYQVDYYGLAGIIYCMLFGKYFEATTVVPANFPQRPVRYKLSTPLKRYWQVDLWTKLFEILFNPTLIRPDGCIPLTSELASIQNEMELWLSSNCNRGSNTLKGLLKKVERSTLSGFTK